MKIAIFVVAAYCRRKYLKAVSGHVQIPLEAARLLSEAGHEVTVITTKPQDSDILPECFPQGVGLHVVEHASKTWPQSGPLIGKTLQLFWQVYRYLRKEKFDTVHFFGGANAGIMLPCMKRFGIAARAFFTPIIEVRVTGMWARQVMIKAAFGGIDRIIALSEYTRKAWQPVLGKEKCDCARPGITKDIQITRKPDSENSVLFWRNAGYTNAVDIVMSAFEDLAPRYKDIVFRFAVRPHDTYEQDLLDLESRVENIETHIFPYKDGQSLERFFEEALFVVQPFRSLSINPQMSILETLYAGLPIITTDIESNNETVIDGKTGLLINSNDTATLTAAIEKLLQDRDTLKDMKKNARAETESRWNWRSFNDALSDIYKHSH